MKTVERDRIIAEAKAEYARVIDQAEATRHMALFRDWLRHDAHIMQFDIWFSFNPKFSLSRWGGRRVHEMPEAERARWQVELEAEEKRWHAERLGRVRIEAKAEYDRAIDHADTEHKRTITAESVKLSSFQWPEYDRAIEAASAGRARARAGPDAGHKDIRTIVRDAAGSKFLRGYRLENIPARPALSDIDREAECSLTFAELSDLDREGARFRRWIAGLKCPFDMAGMRS